MNSWILLSPLYPLPYPVLSLIWETAEILVITLRHDKNKGMRSAAHVGCELILCLAGMVLGAMWISVTFSYMQDSYFTSGESGIPVEAISSWASVTYFWGAVVLLMAIVQFTIFVLSCIEVDRKRRQLEFQVSQIMKVIEERGGNPEEVLRTLQEAPKQSYPPVELSAINQNHPAELSVEERATEMGDENRAGEMPANTPREAKTIYRF
ncbi:hypothetical protein N0V93_001374 [Gnomoniopsis smithogilvyi]|uniref:Uncharacterized protein n=1 Tax=Gnomoniopsis smithogilvyi TaxID=1191159 RepID=A0A9W8Z3U7_9PEZI|nr:hypothetical protein N0V93_001374 [Gnomoniopsis smithogilvyi]